MTHSGNDQRRLPTTWKQGLPMLQLRGGKRQVTDWIRDVLVHTDYPTLNRGGKETVRRYLEHQSGLSKAMVLRHVLSYCARQRMFVEESVSTSGAPQKPATLRPAFKHQALMVAAFVLLTVITGAKWMQGNALQAQLLTAQADLLKLERGTPAQVISPTGTVLVASAQGVPQADADRLEVLRRTIFARVERLQARLGRSAAVNGVTGVSTVASLFELTGKGQDGQILMLLRGKPMWVNLPGSIAEDLDPASRHRPYDPAGGERSYGGGNPTSGGTSTSGGGGSNVTLPISINTDTTGTLAQGRGGLGFTSYSSGDLLLGTSAGGLTKLGIGTQDFVLTSSGGTVIWAPATGGSGGGGGWTDIGPIVRLTSAGDRVGIGTGTPNAKLSVAGSGSFTGSISGSALNIQGDAGYILGDTSIGKSSAAKAKLDVVGTVSGSTLIASSGIGIGTTSIASYLQLGNSTTTQAVFQDFDAIQATSVGVHFRTAGSIIWSQFRDGGNRLRFQNSVGTDVFTLAQGGNVGVNTIAPSVKFQVAGSGSFSSRLAVGGTFAKTPLEVFGTMSGSSLIVNGSITATGALTTRGAVTFRSLTGCTALQTDSTGLLSCGSGGSGTFGTGNVLTIGNARYVSKQGDTMTGALVIQNGNIHSATATPLLNVRGVMSGYRLMISGNANITGSLLVKGNNTTRGTISGALLTQNGGGTNYFLGSVAIGKTSANAGQKLEVLGAISGSSLFVSNLISGSGGLAIRGFIVFRSLTGCANLQTDSNGALSCASTFTQATADSRYVSKQGDTMTGALVIQNGNAGTNTAAALLSVRGTMSGRSLFVSGSGSAPLFRVDSTTGRVTVGVGTGTDLMNIKGGRLSIVRPGVSVYGNQISYNFSVTNYQQGGTYGELALGVDTSGNALIQSYGGMPIIMQPSGNNVGISKTLAKAKLDVLGTISGTALNINGSITATGALTTRGAVTFRSLTGCTALQTDSNGTLSCGSGGSGTFGTGNVLTIGNARYVSKQGDTMTGALVIQNGNIHSATATPLLNVRGTMSGRSLYITGTGGSTLLLTNITTGRVGIGTSSPKAKLDVVGTISGSQLVINNASDLSNPSLINGRLRINPTKTVEEGILEQLTDIAAVALHVNGTMSGKGLVVSGSGSVPTLVTKLSTGFVGIGTSAPKTKLEVAGTISGSALRISSGISASGGLIAQGTIRFRSLTGCAVLTTDSNGSVSCGSGTPTTFGTGNVLTIGNARYVSKQGDTMTGALVINVTGGTQNTLGLRVINTMSGANIHAEQRLTSSGVLVVESGAYLKGSLVLSTDGSTTSNPRRVGMVNFTSGEAGRFEFGDSLNSLQAAHGGRIQIQSYWGMEIAGNRQSGTPLSFDTGRFSDTSTLTVTNTRSDSVALVLAGASSQSANYLNVTANGGADGGVFVISAAGNVGLGKASPSAKLDVVGTISGSLLTQNGAGTNYLLGSVGIGKTSVSAGQKLEVLGSISGSALKISNLISGSGGAVIKGSIAFRSLTGCAVLTTDSNGSVSCGSGTPTTFGTGNVLTIGNARYVSKQGDTMTGALVINVTGGTQNTLGLRVINTMSGANIHAEKLLTASGGLIVEGGQAVFRYGGSASAPDIALYQENSGFFGGVGDIFVTVGGTATFGFNAGMNDSMVRLGVPASSASAPALVNRLDNDTGLYFPATDKIGWVAGSKEMLRISQSGSTLSGSVVIGNTVVGSQKAGIKLEVLGTISGSALRISSGISASGGLIAQGTIRFRSLTGCSSIQSDSNGTLSCGSPSSGNFGSGNVITIGNARYVSKQGDTMTGALVINVTGGTQNTLGLRVINTMSGANIHAEQRLSVSGALIIKKYAGTATGNILVVDTNGLVYNATNKRVGIGTNNPTTALAISTAPGEYGFSHTDGTRILASYVSTTGGWFGTTTNNPLNFFVNNGSAAIAIGTDSKISIFNAAAYTALNVSGGVFSNSTAAPGFVFNSAGSFFGHASNISSDKWGLGYGASATAIGTTVLTWDSNNLVAVTGMLSGSRLTVSGNANITGALLVRGNITTRGALSGAGLTVNGTSTFFGNAVPGADNKYDLGTNTTRWRHLYLSGGTLNLGTSTSSGAISYQSAGFEGLKFFGKASGTASMFISSGGLVGIGTTAPRTQLEVFGTISGSSIRISNALSTSGSLTVQGGVTFRSLTGCTALQTDSNGIVSCGSGGSGIAQSAADNRYVNASGDTMTGTLVIQNGTVHSATATALLNVRGTMSGRSLFITGTGASPLLAANIATGGVGIGTSAASSLLTMSGASAELKIINGGYARLGRTAGDVLTLKNRVSQPDAPLYGVRLNGSSQYITTTNQYTNPTTFSIHTWIKTTTTQGGVIMGFGDAQTGTSTSHDRFIYMSDAGKIYFGIYDSSAHTINSTASYNDGNWHQVIATFSTTNGMNLYVDGSSVATNPSQTTVVSYSGYWRLGFDATTTWASAPTSNYFQGDLDEARVYSTELTSGNVTSLYNGGAGTYGSAGDSGLQSGWHFDEGTGTAAASYSTVSNAATLQASPSWVTGKVSNGASITEVTILSSEGGVSTGEAGIVKLGDLSGGTWLRGRTLQFYTNSLEQMRVSTGGLVGIGTTLPTSKLSVSGSVLFAASGNISPSRTSKATLEVVGTMSGSSLIVNGSITATGALTTRGNVLFRSLTGCTALTTDSTGLVSCGSGSSGITQSGADSRYVNTSGDTMTGTLVIQNGTVHSGTGTALLNVRGTMSGRSLFITGTGASPLFITKITTGNIGFGTSNPNAFVTIRPPAGTSALGLNVAATMSGRSLYITGTGASPLIFTKLSQGRVGIGTSTPSETLDVAGDLRLQNFHTHNVTRTIPSAVGDAVDIGTFSLVQGSTSLEVDIVVNQSGVSTAKHYIIPVYYSSTGNTWQTVLPIASGVYSGGSDFDLEILSNGTSTQLRIRRTLGSGTLTAYIVIKRSGLDTDTFTPSTTSSTVSAPTAIYTASQLTQIGSQVVIGKASGKALLDVAGAMSGASLYIAGNAGIGIVSPRTKFEVRGTMSGNVIVGTYAGFGGTYNPTVPVDVTGEIRSTNTRTQSATRTLPTTVNDEVDIGTYTFTNGGGTLYLDVAVPSNNFSVSKQYLIPVKYNITGGVWQTVLPTASTGPFNSEDFDLDINVTGGSVALRLRRTSGSTAGTAYVSMRQQGLNTDSFTASSATSSVAAPTAFYGPSALTQVSNKVGIGKMTPATALDVVGTLSGSALTINGTGTFSGNLIPGSNNRYDLGTTNNRWRHLYLSGGSLNIGSSSQNGKIGYQYVGTEGLTFFASGSSVSPSMFISSGGLVAIGKGIAVPKAKLDVLGTISGSALIINGSITATGALTTRGTVTFRSLTGCALIQSDSSGVLSCGTPGATGFGTGNVLTIGNARYVSKQGDTMTGALVIQNGTVHSATANALLNVRGTMSGKQLRVTGTGASPLIMTGTGRIGFGTSTPLAFMDVRGAIENGLIGWWPMDESAGSLTTDYSLSNNSGTLLSSPARVTGKHGRALSFNGSNYVTLGTPSELEGLQVPLSIAVWFKPTDTSGNRIIYSAYQSVGSHQLWSMIRLDSGVLTYYTSTSNGSFQGVSSFTPTLNQWHFVVVTVRGTIASPRGIIYMDDRSQSFTLSALSSTPDTSVPLSIGANYSGGEGFVGLIDDLKIYNRDLTLREVQDLYRNNPLGNGGTIVSGLRIESGASLNVAGMLSGYMLTVSGNANITGSLLVRQNITTRAMLSGARLTVSGNANITGALLVKGNISTRGTLSGAALTVMNGNSYLLGSVGIGKTSVSAGQKLEILGSISGSALKISNLISGSGGAVIKGSIAFRSLTGCTALQSDGNGLLSCNSNLTPFGTGQVITIGDTRYVKKQGDTMTGVLVIQNGNTHTATATPLLNVRGTMSGRSLWITGTGAKFSTTTATGSQQPLLAVSAPYGTIMLGTGSMKNGTGAMAPQLFINGRLTTTGSMMGVVGGFSTLKSMAMQGKYMYIVDSSSFYVYDMTNPARPALISTISSYGGNGIVVQGAYAYIVQFGSMGVVDISNPASPFVVSSISTSTFATSIAISGRYAYVTTYFGAKMEVYDVANPVQPKMVAAFSPLVLPTFLTVQGQYAYVIVNGAVKIFDISNPFVPVLVSTNTTSLSTPKHISIEGRYAYIADQSNGLVVYDISNPASPAAIGSYGGISAEFVFAQGRNVYVADTTSGARKFMMFDVSNPRAPKPVTSVAAPLNQSPSFIIVQGRYAYVGYTNQVSVYDLGGAYIQQLSVAGLDATSLSVTNGLAALNGDFRGGVSVGAGMQVRGPSSFIQVATGSTTLDVISAYTGALRIAARGTTGAPQIWFGTGNTFDTNLFRPTGLTLQTNANLYGRSFSGTQLYIRGAMSGYSLKVSGNISASGAVMLEGALSGATINGFGLGNDCDGTANKVTWDVTTQRFKCEADQTGASSGISFATAEGIYVNQAGDTMTGALVIQKTGGTPGTPLLNVRGIMSGKTLFLSGSGSKTPALQIAKTSTGFAMLLSGSVIRQNAYGTPATLSGLVLGNSIGAYAVAADRGYAFVGRATVTGNEFQVIDVINPRAPRIIGGLDLGVDVNDVKVQGRYAYLSVATAYNGWSLVIVDIAVPSAPMVVGGYASTSGMNKVFVSGKYAYGVFAAGNKFRVIDISNPRNATLLGSCAFGQGGLRDIYVRGSVLYTANEKDNGTSTIDVNNPMVISGCPSGGTISGDPAKAIVVDGNYSYRVYSDTFGGGGTKLVARQLNSATDTTFTITGSTLTPYSLALAGRYILVGAADANSNQNLYIVDISDPLNMRNVGVVRTALNVGVRGIAVEGKYAYIVTDGTSGFGFRVIDLPGADLPTATIGRLSAFEILTHGDMRVGQNLSVGDGLQVGRGGIYSQGSLTVIAHGTGASLNALDVRTGSGNPILVATSSGAVGIGSGVALNARMTVFTDNAFNQTALAIKSKETTSTQNMFTITTDYNSTNNLVYRITASGATYADAPYNSAGADYAEYFPSDPQVSIAPGEAVCLDPTKTNMVKRCDREADPNIIGIRSTKPSVVGNAVAGTVLDGLGLPVPGYTLVGLIGQLDSRATTVGSGGVIKSGDPLTSSAIPGVLRKALPGESTVGVALTGLAEGEGDIRVLIARTNTSNLTDKIDAEVSAHVAALKVDDKIKASLEAVISDSTFDERITSVVTAQLTELHPLQDRVLTLEQTISNLSAQILALSGSTFHGTSDMGQVTGDNLTLTGSVNASDLTSENTLTVGRDARIGGDLYLEGALKVGSLIIPGGATIEGDVTTGKLKAASGSQIDGTLTVAGDLLVSRNLVFQTGATISAKQLLLSGALLVRGPITIEGLATFLGDVDVKGELTVSARQAGYALVKAGESKVVVRFDPPFKAIPVVTVAPQGRVGSEWWTDRATMTGFTIFTDKPVPADVTFSFMALSTAEPHTASGSFASAPAGTTFFPVDEHGIPVSSSAIWNACIRHEQPMDPATGQPFSCSRYTPDLYIWNHPDFPGMTFVFNDSYNPPLLVLPEGFVSQTVSSSPVENSSSSSDSSDSSLSSSSESSSSSDSSSSDSSSSESSVSSESSSSSEQSSSSDSSSSDSSSSNSSSSDSFSSDSSSSGGSSSSQ